MHERIIKHPAGRFMRCRQCNAEPRHVGIHGRSIREPVQFVVCGVRHTLECSGQCGARTGVHASLAQAEAQWGTDYAQLALPLRATRRRRAA